MYPYIHTGLGELSTFTILIIVGVTAMIGLVHIALKGSNRNDEEAFIFPRLVMTGLIGFVFATVFDLTLKYLKYGVFKIYGITFYGGLIGAIFALFVILKLSKNKTRYSINSWFELLTMPFIAFHFFGRLGCFFAGCCYGRNADNIFALSFPDNAEMGITHNGLKCYPTQLFEALALIIVFIIVKKAKNKFKTYLVCYTVLRFNLEFLRGDDRGVLVGPFSPSQAISLFILCVVIVYEFIKFFRLNNSKHQSQKRENF